MSERHDRSEVFMPDLTPDGLIHDRGRGPEIKGTRITVYDILDYHTRGREPAYIAGVLGLTTEQVCGAIRYIEEHRQEIMPDYQAMVELAERGNPPHIRAMLEESHKKVMALKEVLARKKREDEAARLARGGAADARAIG